LHYRLKYKDYENSGIDFEENIFIFRPHARIYFHLITIIALLIISEQTAHRLVLLSSTRVHSDTEWYFLAKWQASQEISLCCLRSGSGVPTHL